MAVPDGASTLSSWCSSMISTPSMKGAASSAKRAISTAPIAKLAATTQLAFEPANASVELVELRRRESGRADDRVDAVRRAPPQVPDRRVRDGEVDRHVCACALELFGVAGDLQSR